MERRYIKNPVRIMKGIIGKGKHMDLVHPFMEMLKIMQYDTKAIGIVVIFMVLMVCGKVKL